MYSAKGHLASPRWGCPIRTSPDQSLLAAPRGLSQPSTSFIGSWCQGIHRAPLLARRLDLSNPPSRQDQRSQKDTLKIFTYCLLRSSPSVSRAPSAESDACSTTLRFFRCKDRRSLEHRSWRLDLPQVLKEAPRPALQLLSAGVGTKIARRSVEPRGLHDNPSAENYAVGDSSLRIIHLSTGRFQGAHATQRLVRIPRMFTISARPPGVQAVEPRGFEPLTSALQRRRSPN